MSWLLSHLSKPCLRRDMYLDGRIGAIFAEMSQIVRMLTWNVCRYWHIRWLWAAGRCAWSPAAELQEDRSAQNEKQRYAFAMDLLWTSLNFCAGSLGAIPKATYVCALRLGCSCLEQNCRRALRACELACDMSDMYSHSLATNLLGEPQHCEKFWELELLRSASTSENSKAVFHESLSILVEQGTNDVTVEFRGSMTLPPLQLWDVRRGQMAGLSCLLSWDFWFHKVQNV